MNRFGIVIVTYNSEAEIGACLDACLEKVGREAVEIVVVDNRSADETRREVLGRPGVRLIANETNDGFAAGANRGIRALETEHVLLLNPDVQLMTGVEPLLECCRRDGVAAAAGKLVDEQGHFQSGWAIRRFPGTGALVLEALGLNRIWTGNPINRRYRCLDLDPERKAEVEQPAGAFLMIRRETWRRLGGFDESFRPLWFEDVDFLKRARDSGLSTWYDPSVVAKHKGGHSVRSIPWGQIQVCWYSGLLNYASKHLSRLGCRGVSIAVILGFTARTLARVFRDRSLKPIGVCSKVVRLAASALAGRPQVVTAAPVLK
jgi:GT2 family glycosyltransferase